MVSDFLITCHIYESCGNLSPGALTDLRSALVNNVTFACLAVRYGLHTCLLAYAPQLHEIINRFVKFQEERDYAINDEVCLWNTIFIINAAITQVVIYNVSFLFAASYCGCFSKKMIAA